jgi:PiT family inorganic phosphate transporter
MGLIMLILIGTVPTAYALNRTMHEGDVSKFVAISTQARRYCRAMAAARPRRPTRAQPPWA